MSLGLVQRVSILMAKNGQGLPTENVGRFERRFVPHLDTGMDIKPLDTQILVNLTSHSSSPLLTHVVVLIATLQRHFDFSQGTDLAKVPIDKIFMISAIQPQ